MNEASALKGHFGELQVIKELNKLPRDKYFIINDLLIEHEGFYSQIDHLVVSVYGIFIIETKNWSGKIYGDQYSTNWQQYINGNKK